MPECRGPRWGRDGSLGAMGSSTHTGTGPQNTRSPPGEGAPEAQLIHHCDGDVTSNPRGTWRVGEGRRPHPAAELPPGPHLAPVHPGASGWPSVPGDFNVLLRAHHATRWGLSAQVLNRLTLGGRVPTTAWRRPGGHPGGSLPWVTSYPQGLSAVQEEAGLPQPRPAQGNPPSLLVRARPAHLLWTGSQGDSTQAGGPCRTRGTLPAPAPPPCPRLQLPSVGSTKLSLRRQACHSEHAGRPPIQWSGRHASTAGGEGSVPGQGIDPACPGA